jgi:hypothetical protein
MIAKDVHQQAGLYRARADAIRTAAFAMSDAKCRDVMLNMAESYEGRAAAFLDRLGPKGHWNLTPAPAMGVA